MSKIKVLDYKGLMEYNSQINNVIKEHSNDVNNPHNVTVEQIGLGKKLYINDIEYNGTSDVAVNLLPFVIGLQSNVTNKWIGSISTVTDLKDGLSIRYWLPFDSNGDVTLKLSLCDYETDNIPCYYEGIQRLSTQYKAGSMIILTYRKNIKINGSAETYTGWWAQSDYNSICDYRIRLENEVKAKCQIENDTIIVSDGNDGYIPLQANIQFDITYPILYTDKSLQVNELTNNVYLLRDNLSFSSDFSFNVKPYNMIYLKGTLNGTKFIPYENNTFTSNIPTFEDGYVYMLFGYAHSSNAYTLLNSHPLYVFDENTGFCLLSSISSYAQKANMDKYGQVIDSTYIKDIFVNGNQLTITWGNGETKVLKTQDTTYDIATETTSGLISAEMMKKLLGIEDGAQRNVKSDWNATSGDAQILNRPLFEEKSLFESIINEF